MATITLKVEAGANTYTKTRTVSNADLQRLVVALRSKNASYNDDPENPPRDLSKDDDLVDLWLREIMIKAKSMVVYEETGAVQKAMTEIVVS